ncbi:EAL domain-containing protein [Massilia sp. TN1-12]|uniref:EAL domain-containing protein n=1 Tax=Massilia paldalensis TaxID=3377675 RepID=UPI00384FF396
MRRRLGLGLTGLATIAALVIPPWLAWREAQRQAWAAEAEHALAVARDVLHRTDEAALQIIKGNRTLARSGLKPCSPASLALMRRIALGSSYIHAIGWVENGVLVCSSMGPFPIPLGSDVVHTNSGALLYPNVPLPGAAQGALLAVEGGGYATIIHRDTPVDASGAAAGVARGVLHLSSRRAVVAHGRLDPAWVGRLGAASTTTFADGDMLVAIVRSRLDTIAAVAAVPLTGVAQRAHAIALRLVPAGLVSGLVAATAIGLLLRRRMSLGMSLAAALRRGEFFLLYQPIVDLQTGRWVGAEALLRWRRANGELVGPDVFIPAAEQSGQIVKLTEHVIDVVGRDAGAFLRAHPDFHVAINLSAADVQSPAIVDRLAAMLASCGARPSNLIVEITERGFLHLEAAREVIRLLRAQGIGVAIDDFGTGYSSLSYLESLDLDYLKIDRAFIEAIGTDAPTSGVVGLIIEMARSMQLAMIAEGIENPAQAAYLRERGVEFAQGWLFGKPMPFADIAHGADGLRHAA